MNLIKDLNDLRLIQKSSTITQVFGPSPKMYKTYIVEVSPDIQEGNNGTATIRSLLGDNNTNIQISVQDLLDGSWYLGAG